MRVSPLLALLALTVAPARADIPAPTPPSTPFFLETCGDPPVARPVTLGLPAGVTGRVSFYAAEYDPSTLAVRQAVSYGPVTDEQPIASMFKPLVVALTFRDVDAGRVTLTTRLRTTPRNRSIETFPPGTNTVQTLARRAIELSDNTAADILLLNVGPERLTRAVLERSPCTRVFLTGKAAWAAQGGLQANLLGPDLLTAAREYAARTPEDRLPLAGALIRNAQQYGGPDVQATLDMYFRGPAYSPEVDLAFQHRSTAKAFTDLVARVYSGRNLTPGTRRVFRNIMALGCCAPRGPRLPVQYWAAKAGSGWRTLALSGYVELRDGRVLAYTYLNDLSDSRDAEVIERQIRPVVTWIESNLLDLTGR